MISAKVIEDSIGPGNVDRLTTLQVTFNRFILPEFNTHRIFSRNSASSRAIPIEKQIQKIKYNCAFPLEFGTNKPGMQAGDPLTGDEEQKAREIWQESAELAIQQANKLIDLNVHKQVVNRLLEPFMWHTVIVTATDWEGFFAQRISDLAQPEIDAIAKIMLKEIEKSIPNRLNRDEWHLPYIQHNEKHLPLEVQKKVSAARCARVSYLTHDGVCDVNRDLELYSKLMRANPKHWSPLEHVAVPYERNRIKIGHADLPVIGNLTGWIQLRHEDFIGVI